ncbi:MAG: hypothetical protein Q9215_004459 [Flavoplaca cf. flavocitrina]
METLETPEDLKSNLFKELYELDVSDDSVNDVGTVLAAFRAAKPAPKLRTTPQTINRRGATRATRKLQQLGRTVSAPTSLNLAKPKLLTTDSRSIDDETPQETVDAIVLNSPLVAKLPGEEIPTKMAPTARGKRKRGRSLEVLPEAQQIFRGSKFCKYTFSSSPSILISPPQDFLPNDDVAPARKLRINKVLERGGTWVKNWSDGITHIIVDKNLTYNDLLKYLKISSIPVGQSLSIATVATNAYYYPYSPTPSQIEANEQPRTHKPTIVDNTIGAPPSKSHPLNSKLHDGPADALDLAIEDMLAVKDLPLDDEDFVSPSSSMATDDSNDEDGEKGPDRTKANPSIGKSWQAKFSCMDKHTGTENHNNPNAETIEVLKQMTDYYERTNEHWRTIAYRKAIAALKKQTHKITTKEEAFTIPCIGSRLALKIQEIVETGRLRRLDNTNCDSADIALQLFLRIYGVGHNQASLWINKGYRTLNDLLTKATLTTNQKIGIDHIEDFATRIPRSEVEHHGRIVREATHKEDPSISITIGGSYRRGAPDSGDVDFIITKPDASIDTLRTIILDTVIPSLFRANYLQHALASTSRSDGSKWHGCATLPGSKIWHRIDFLLVPHAEIGAALIYFTGNDIFNRSIRLLASRKGTRLNQGLVGGCFEGEESGADYAGAVAGESG